MLPRAGRLLPSTPNHATRPRPLGGLLTVDGVTGSWATSESSCKPFLESSYDDDEDITDWVSVRVALRCDAGVTWGARDSGLTRAHPMPHTPHPTPQNPTKSCSNSCTQQTSGVCSAAFLAGVLKGSGVKYAYCNADYLHMYSDGVPTIWTANLNDVPYPPGDSTNSYRTGMKSLDTARGQEVSTNRHDPTPTSPPHRLTIPPRHHPSSTTRSM